MKAVEVEVRLGTAVAVLFLVALTVPASHAVEVRRGESVVIGVGEVIDDDLYVSGDTVEIDGKVDGDLIFSGRQLTVSGQVTGDLIAAGQAIVVAGEVGDDVRIAGMALKLSEGAVVGDDLFAAGLSLETETESSVAGSVVVTGYQARLAGEVQEDLKAAVVGLELDGTVHGDVEAEVESEAGPGWWLQFLQSPVPLPTVESGLGLGDGARVEGRLRYTSRAAARTAEGARVEGEVEHREPEVEPVAAPTLADRSRGVVRRMAALLVVGLVLIWVAPGALEALATTVETHPLASLGWGLASLVGIPVAMLVLLLVALVLALLFGSVGSGWLVAAVLLLGLLLQGIVGVGLWLGAFFLAPIVVGLVSGRWLAKRALRKEKSRILALVLGLVMLAVIFSVPVLGTLVKWLIVLVGVGSIALRSAPALRSIRGGP